MTVRLLCFALLLVARSALAVPPRDFHVFAYDLDLVIDRAHHRLTGRERLHLRNDIRGLTTLVFPGHGISVRSVTSQDGAPLAYSTAHDEIRIHPPNSFAEGDTLAFTIQYEATKPQGVVFHPDCIYSSFFTSHWMVCRDRPDDKATFSLSLTVPESLGVVASGERVAMHAVAGARTQHVWHEAVPSSSYLFGFAIGQFTRTVREHRGVTFEYDVAGADSQ